MSRYRILAAACGAVMAAALAAPLEAQMGLSRVEYLALQQELRSRGCGDIAAGGQVDAATQRALQACARQLGVAANARAVLNAMDIGFGSGYQLPTLQEARDPHWEPDFQPGVQPPMQPADLMTQPPAQPTAPQMQPAQPADPQMPAEPGYPAQPPAGQAPPPAQPGLETLPPAPQPGAQPPPTQPPVTQPPPGSQPPVIP
jgi:hypothetical protein